MSMVGPMRDELYRYRKRKTVSLNGSTPGLQYHRYRRLTPSGSIHLRPNGTFYHNLYVQNTQQQYDLRFGSNPADDYVEYENTHFIRRPEPKLFMPLPEVFHPDEQDHFDYEKAQRAEQLFSEFMAMAYERTRLEGAGTEQQTPVEPEAGLTSKLQNDKLCQFFDITDALGVLQDVLPQNHPDIVNLRQAISGMLEKPDFVPQLEDFGVEDIPSKLGGRNPYEHDDLVDYNAVSVSALEQTHPEESLWTAEADGAWENAGMPEGDNLEQMVDREYAGYEHCGPEVYATEDGFVSSADDMGMQPDSISGLSTSEAVSTEAEIEQAIDQAMESSQPGFQPDPWQMQQDPFGQMQQYMPFGGMMGPMPGP